MKVRFYQFAKRKSTAIPTGEYHEIDCTLKEATFIKNPIITVQTFIPFSFNYAYIPAWGRYYYISDCQANEGMWDISLTEDVLASFKAEIGNTSANIMYASGSTKNIADTRIPVKAEILRGHEYTAISGLTITDGQGVIIVGITGKGSFGPYMMQASPHIKELLDGIDTWWTTTVDSTIASIKQCFFGGSAAECLKSAIALPLIIGGEEVSDGTTEDLYLGNYPCMLSDGQTHIKGYHITKPVIHKDTTISIPWQTNDWTRLSAYTDIKLYLPLIGIINLPATELQNDSSVDVRYSINVTSGDIAVEVKGTTSGYKVATASGNCAMNTAYGSTGIDLNKQNKAIGLGIGAMASTFGAMASGGLTLLGELAIGGALATAMGTSIAALGGTSDGSGGLGGGASQGLDSVIHIFLTTKDLADTQTNFNPIIGKPYMGVSKPSNFSGYVQTDGFQFKSSRAYSSEIEEINKLLDTGIYYE